MAVRSVLIALLLLAVAAPAAGAQTLRLGFLDGEFSTSDAPTRQLALDRAVAAGSDVVRLTVGWDGTAPDRPRSPEDPADPAYLWESADDVVKDATARGLEVILNVTGAPRWAQGAGRPDAADVGPWRPDATAYGRFAVALATRYSGTYPDPAAPETTLPRVTTFQPWNEPNLQRYLAPQWTRRAGRLVTASPGIYRGLLNAFARSVKSVDAQNRVVAGTTAPFGDPEPGGRRMAPALFVREVLRRPAVFDVLAHHPYSTRGPFAAALNTDDVSIPDIGKLVRPLRAAERAGRISPRGRRPVWVTEVSWDSSPPDPEGVPAARHARWLSEALYVLWRQGVRTVTWFQLRDQAPEPSFGQTYQSGVLLRDGTPKRAHRAFRFPFVARASGGRTLVWLRAPEAGEVVIERRTSTGWRRVAAVGARRHAVVQRRVAVRRGTTLRARQGAQTSLPYRAA